MKNCIFAQSGGPTAVINSSACGVIMAARENPYIDKVYGALYGIEGVIKEEFIDFTNEDEDEIELLKYTPSSALGSCRYRLKEYKDDKAEYEKIFKAFEKMNIGYFFYIGGNDSMDTVDKLSKYAAEKNIDIKIMGIPKTIDNDLPITDHTPGFGSAAKYIAASVMEIARDGAVYDKSIINVVEVMGRHAGWLAAAAALANRDKTGAPDLIYLPESVFSMDKFLEDVKRIYDEKNQVNVVVSEGIKDSEGRFISETNSGSQKDAFGHTQMGGVGEILGSIIKEKICSRVKVIEFNVLQRCAMHYASATDIDEAYMCGYQGVEYAVKGETGKMVGLKRTSNSPYKCDTMLIDISSAANKEKVVPKEFINEEGNFVTDKAVEYLAPLIQGEVMLPTEDGLPKYAKYCPCGI